MNSYNVYEKLYNNTKSKFAVVSGDNEYTLGEYMMMKAEKKAEKSHLPAAKALTATTGKAVSSIFSYITDKITIKNPPAKDKIIRKFPMRTSAAAFLSAILMSALALSFALFSAGRIAIQNNSVAESEYSESQVSDSEYSNEK